MKPIEEIIRETTEETQEKVDWTKAWRMKKCLPCPFPRYKSQIALAKRRIDAFEIAVELIEREMES